MKKIIVFIFMSLYLPLVITSCGDVFPKGDPYKRAKEKHRFFRCKINGKEWRNLQYSNGWFGGADSYMEFYEAPDSVEESGLLIIKMIYEPDKYTDEVMNFYKTHTQGGENIIDNIKGTVYYTLDPIYKEFELDTNYHKTLFITDIDTTNKIITGQFEFRIISWDKIDTFYVTDGEFDWKPYWRKWK